jgi:hypothetical protein
MLKNKFWRKINKNIKLLKNNKIKFKIRNKMLINKQINNLLKMIITLKIMIIKN